MDISRFKTNIRELVESNNRKEKIIEYICGILRTEIYKHLLFTNDESEFFNIANFKFYKQNNEEFQKSVERIMAEIETCGLKTKLGYGNSALFIFKENIPENCW